MSRAGSILIQCGIIATAFLLGCGVRWWRQRPAAMVRENQNHSINLVVGPPVAIPGPTSISLSALDIAARSEISERIASAHTPTGERASLLFQLFRGAKTTEDAALLFEILLRDPDATSRERNHLCTALTLWGRLDSAAALAATQRIGFYQVRDDAVASVLRAWAERDFPSALAYLRKETGGPVAINGPRILCEFLAGQDPQFAMDTLLQEGWLHQWDNQNGPAFRILQQWLEKDPDAAWKFVLSRGGDERDTLLLRLGTAGMSRNKQDTWIRLTNPETRTPETVLYAALADWREVARNDALGAVLALPAGDLQQKLLIESGADSRTRHLSSFPDEAAKLMDRVPAGLQRDAFARGLVTNAAFAKSWTPATTWISQITDPTLHTDAMRTLGAEWSEADTGEASAWLAQQSPSDGRDVFARALAKKVFDEDPEAALAWATSIRDPARREPVLQELMEKWQQLDPAAAQAWQEP